MTIIGHEDTKKQVGIAISSARARNMSVPHILLSGAAGCGKTSLARYIATLTGSPFLSVIPNDMKDRESVTRLVEKLNHVGYDSFGNRIGAIKPTILFFDEAHNMPLKGQELLGLAMERFCFESGKPDEFYWIPFFTMVVATTLAGRLSKPFRDRFKITFNFQPYEINDMIKIVRYHSNKMGMIITPTASKEIAIRSRGTPRVAVGFIEGVRDLMIASNARLATTPLVRSMFDNIGIDEEGFSSLETRILKILFEAAVPISLDNLSVMLQEDSKSIKDFAEPFLIRKGMMLVSGKGRIITEKGIEHLKNIGKSNRLIKHTIPFDYERK